MCSTSTAHVCSTATAKFMLASSRRASSAHGGGDPAYARMQAARGLHMRAHHIQARVVVGDAVANKQDVQSGGGVQLAQGERQQQRGNHARSGSHAGEQAAPQDVSGQTLGSAAVTVVECGCYGRSLCKDAGPFKFEFTQGIARFQLASHGALQHSCSGSRGIGTISGIACCILACSKLLVALPDNA